MERGGTEKATRNLSITVNVLRLEKGEKKRESRR